jgi:hypothetical protein
MVASSRSFSSIFEFPNDQLIFQKWFCSPNPLDLENIVIIVVKKQEKKKEKKKENRVL